MRRRSLDWMTTSLFGEVRDIFRETRLSNEFRLDFQFKNIPIELKLIQHFHFESEAKNVLPQLKQYMREYKSRIGIILIVSIMKQGDMSYPSPEVDIILKSFYQEEDETISQFYVACRNRGGERTS